MGRYLLSVWSPAAGLSILRFGAGKGVEDGDLYCVRGRREEDDRNERSNRGN